MRIHMDSHWKRHADDAAHDYLVRISREVLTDMQSNCPVDTGTLLQDLDYEVIGTSARVGAQSVDYVLDVEYGTAPHTIEPKDKDALYWPGAAHPVKKVEHPGTDAQPFMRDALYRRRGA